MKKKLFYHILALLCCSILLFGLTACVNKNGNETTSTDHDDSSSSNDNGNNIDPPPHEHTFSDEWSNDRTYHWHEATCDHTNEKKDYAEHTLGADYCCTVCSYTLNMDPTEGLEYQLNGDDSAYIVTGIGTATDTDIIIPATYQNLPVTEIKEMAFCLSAQLTSITIPNSIISIGIAAFAGCSDLSSILVDPANPVYMSAGNCLIEKENKMLLCGCNNSIIPDDGRVTGIAQDAFFGCTGLTSISIPKSITSIGIAIFSGCSNLTSITVDPANKVYHSDGNCLIETETKTLIAGCKNSTIPANGSVTEIDEYAFSGCSELTSITIPNSITTIGVSAFADCTKLKNIEISNGITDIGSNAFDNCTELNRISIPNSVISIGYDAFAGCSGIIQIENGISYVDKWAIACDTSVTEVKLRTDTVGLATQTFRDCMEITSIDIPDSVISIGKDAFYCCERLTNVKLGNHVAYIGNSAFSRCGSLSAIILPNTIKSIGSYIFTMYASPVLTTIYYDGTAEEWSNITIDTRNDVLMAATVYYYSEAKPTEGDYWHYVDGNPEVWKMPTLEEYFTFTLLDDNTYSITANQKDILLAKLVIPSAYHEIAVTNIGSHAFAGCTQLTNITIPDSITSIDWNAFYNCTNLKDIIIGKGVTSINHSAFEGCTNLANITVDNANSAYQVRGNCLIEKATKTLIRGCNNSVIPNNGSITSIGYSAFTGCTNLTNITIPNGVTSIGIFAFGNCSSLTNITLPNSVTSIRTSAFEGCSSLVNITIPDNITYIENSTFKNCSSLASIIIPDSVTRIGSWAFSGCSSLASVIIGNGVTSITDYSIFEGCSNLASITIGSGVTNINSDIFRDCPGVIQTENGVSYVDKWVIDCDTSVTNVTLRVNTVGIGSNAFQDCSSLTNITIPNGVTTIDVFAFEGCSSLVTITIPDSVTEISYHAFIDCTNLTDIIIGNGVTSIKDSAFENCTKLAIVYYLGTEDTWRKIEFRSYNDSLFNAPRYYYSETLPTVEGNYWYYSDGIPKIWLVPTSEEYFTFTLLDDGTYSIKPKNKNNLPNEIVLPFIYQGKEVTTIDNLAFRDCTRLTSVTFPDSIVSIGNSAFSGCTQLTDIIFYDGIISIGKQAFYGCTGLTSIILPNSVTDIGSSAFSGCTGLTSIILPNKITSIEASVFKNCTELINITIPDSVTSIGSNAFEGCTKLTNIVIPTSVTSIDNRAFYNCSNVIKIENGVSYVDKWVIDFDASVTNVVLRADTIGIAERAFLNLTSLTSITIPNSVTSIDNRAFYRCTALTIVYYDGSADEWNAISIGNYNDPLTSATIYYYSENEPNAAGNYWHYVDGIPTAW